MKLDDALTRVIELAQEMNEEYSGTNGNDLESAEGSDAEAVRIVSDLHQTNRIHAVSPDDADLHNQIYPALVNVLHCAEGTLEPVEPVKVDIDNCRKVSQYIEHCLIRRPENKVFNVADLKQQLWDNIDTCLDGAFDQLTDDVRNATLGQLSRVIIDTVEPPYERTHTADDGTVFHVQQMDATQWSAFRLVGLEWELMGNFPWPKPANNPCISEANAVETVKFTIAQGWKP